jgi:hypothetical protein
MFDRSISWFRTMGMMLGLALESGIPSKSSSQAKKKVEVKMALKKCGSEHQHCGMWMQERDDRGILLANQRRYL